MSVVVAAPARAFDPYPWAKDDIITCFSGSDWTANEKARVNEAVAHWEASVDSLDIAHQTGISCPSTWVELDWVSDLNGALGVTQMGTSGPVYIRFAENGSVGAIPWYTGSSSSIPSGEYDFRSTASHELGHALGLKHPEYGGSYAPKSFDGATPVMKASSGAKGVNRRTLRQDDRAGGEFVVRDNILVKGYSSSSVGYWGAANGSLTDCGEYLCLSKNSSSSYSYMYMTTRMTADGRSDRQDPRIKFSYRGSTYSTGMRVRAVVKSNQVTSGGSMTGSYLYSYGGYCTDTYSSDSWQVCDSGVLDTKDVRVADVRIYIRNYSTSSGSSGTVHIDKATADFTP